MCSHMSGSTVHSSCCCQRSKGIGQNLGASLLSPRLLPAEANQKLQIDRFKTVALPLYVVLDSDNRLLTRHAGILEPAERFLRFLRLQDQG